MSEYYYLGEWDDKGVPKYLSNIETLDPNIINRIFTALPERQNVPIDKPNYITSDKTRNLIIKTEDKNFTDCEVYVTFLYEGAGYKNVVGYYTYPLNDGYTVPTKMINGEWVPMDYKDRNLVDKSGKSILNKTIVFPNASLPTWANSDGRNAQAGGGNLLPGSTVKLVYDHSTGSTKFPNNTGIGFFVIPNGWSGSIRNWAERVHTDSVFNLNNSTQVVLLSDGQSFDDGVMRQVLAFEDIMRPNGDSDFNDLIIRISSVPFSNGADLSGPVIFGLEDMIVLPTSGKILEDKIITGRSGLYYELTDETVKILSALDEVSLVHIINMTNKHDQYKTLKEVFRALRMNTNCEIVYDDENREDDDDIRTITITSHLNKGDVQNYCYIFNAFNNRDQTSPVNPNVSCLVEFQNIYSKNDALTIKDRSYKFRSKNNVIKEDHDPCRTRNHDSPYAMGDPHIRTIYGSSYDLPSDTRCYELFNNEELALNCKLDHFYMNDNNVELRDLTFLRYVCAIYKDEHIIVDMFHPDTYYINEVGNKLDSDMKYFEFCHENIVPVSSKRREYYSKLINTTNFELRYIKVNTFSAGIMYIEILFVPHRCDLVNSVSIISDMVSETAKGALIHEKYAKVIETLFN